jgi:hypothetical protein
MFKNAYCLVLSLAVLIAASSCSIVKNVAPVQSGKTIDKIYVATNKNVKMEGLHSEVLEQLRSLGFQADSYSGAPPAGAVYTMVYTANWHWDMAMYLTYFQATLLENGRVLGRAEYDATHGSGRMDKFGKTAEKIRPLLMDLLTNVDRSKSAAPVMDAH